jgi:predicted amidohydrolase
LPVVRLALAQMSVDPGRPDANLARAADWIGRAAAKGAELVLLPETLDLGWTDPSARTLAAPIPDGGPCRRLAEAARRHGLHVCAGLTERAGDRVFNAAVIIDPDGVVRLHHRKLNELGIGHASYDQGDRLGVVRLPFGTVGLMICADGFARGEIVARTLALMGADLIVSPCAWAVPPDHDPRTDPYGALWRDCHGRVARGFGLHVAATSCVGPIAGGPWAGHRCIGCSLVVGPDGEPLLQGPYGEDAEALLVVDLPLAPRRARGDEWWR